MLVRNRMSHPVVTVEPRHAVADARQLLHRHGFRHLPVIQRQRLVGIVTDRDLRSAPAKAITVAQLMSPKPWVIAPDSSVDEAARLLRQRKIGALPVVENGRLLGILTASDILDAFVDISGVAQPTFRLVVAAPKGKGPEQQVREVVQKARGELKWLHRDSRDASRLHLRLRARGIDDVVYALEAAGFAVTAVIASSASRRS